jgi:hypothetical protein
MLNKSLSICMLLCIGLDSANAGFIETDWQEVGDGKATLHEETGIEWLNVSETSGLSVNEALAQTVDGGIYEGWRLPSFEEVDNWWRSILAGNYILTLGEGHIIDDSNYGETAKAWMEANGLHDTIQARSYGIGLTSDGDYGFWGVSRVNDNTRYRYGAYEYTANTTHTYAGVFLVSDGGLTLSSTEDPTLNASNPNAPINQVPEPSMLALMALGSLGLFGAGARRRKQS